MKKILILSAVCALSLAACENRTSVGVEIVNSKHDHGPPKKHPIPVDTVIIVDTVTICDHPGRGHGSHCGR